MFSAIILGIEQATWRSKIAGTARPKRTNHPHKSSYDDVKKSVSYFRVYLALLNLRAKTYIYLMNYLESLNKTLKVTERYIC